MDWLEQVGFAIRAADIGTIGDNVFAFTMPADLQDGAMLTDTMNGMPIDPELPDYYKGKMLLVVRAISPATARLNAEDITTAIAMVGGTLPGFKVNYIRPKNTPAVFPRSGGDFYEASVYFDVCFVRL